jgi:hypothetical protein
LGRVPRTEPGRASTPARGGWSFRDLSLVASAQGVRRRGGGAGERQNRNRRKLQAVTATLRSRRAGPTYWWRLSPRARCASPRSSRSLRPPPRRRRLTSAHRGGKG